MQHVRNKILFALLAFALLWAIGSSAAFAKKVKYPVITHELDLITLYNNNVFRTSRFLSPTDGFATIPKYHFGYKIKTFGSHKFQFDYRIKAKLYLPFRAKLENASGYNHSLKFSFLGKSKKNRKLKKQNRHEWDYGLGYKSSQYKYLDRDTGNLKAATVEDSYMYDVIYLFAGYDLKGSDKSILHTNISIGSRDYKNTGTTSFDRNVISLGGSYTVPMQKHLRWKIHGDFTNNKYKSNTSEDTAGTAVPGTSQELNDLELGAKLLWNQKDYFFSPFVSLLARQDTYQGYWSYNQLELGWKISKKMRHKQKLSGEISVANRSYAHETAPGGAVRDRSVTNFNLKWEQKQAEGKVYVQLAKKSQLDTDPYYSYDQLKITLGILMEL